MEARAHLEFLEILQNPDKRFGTERGHVIWAGPGRDLSGWEESCFDSEQSRNRYLTARYTLQADPPSVVIGTLLRRLADDIMDWPSSSKYSLGILRESGTDGGFGWQSLLPAVRTVLDNLASDPDGTVSLDWIAEAVRAAAASPVLEQKSAETPGLVSGLEPLVPGERIVVFLRLEGEVAEADDWAAALESLGRHLPYRSLLVVSGLGEFPTEAASDYLHSVPLEDLDEGESKSAPDDAADLIEQRVLIGENSALNDKASVVDHLNRGIYAEAIVKLLCHKETSPPLTIGIHGPWGMGKSSFMDQMHNGLKTNDTQDFASIRFNAWRYNDNHQVWAGLLNSVSREIEAKIGWFQRLTWQARSFWRKARLQFFLGLGFFALVAVVAAYFVPVDENNRRIWGEAWTVYGVAVPAFASLLVLIYQKAQLLSSRIANAARLPRHDVELGFQNLVMSELQEMQSILKKKKAGCRTVVFIDDLDRCAEDRIIETLQAIILVLAESEVFVVLGIDTQMIYRAVERKYKDERGHEQDAERFARRYLQKIIQLSFHLPPIDDPSRTAFLDRQFSETSVAELNAQKPEGDPAAEDDDVNPDDLMLSFDPSLVLDVNPATEPVLEDLVVRDTATELEAFHDFQNCLQNNPREIKRAVNIHRLVKLLILARGGRENGWPEDRQRCLVRWILFCSGWPSQARAAMGLTGEIEDIVDHCIDEATPASSKLDATSLQRLQALKSQDSDFGIRPSDLDDELRFAATVSALLEEPGISGRLDSSGKGESV